MRVYRVRSNGEEYRPAVTKSGKYQLADPTHGTEKHHAKHAIYADSLSEAVALIRERGFSIWMRGVDTGQRNLIAPKSIRIE